MSSEHSRNPKRSAQPTSTRKKRHAPALFEMPQEEPARPQPPTPPARRKPPLFAEAGEELPPPPAPPTTRRKPPLFPLEEEGKEHTPPERRAAPPPPTGEHPAPTRRPPLFPLEEDDESIRFRSGATSSRTGRTRHTRRTVSGRLTTPHDDDRYDDDDDDDHDENDRRYRRGVVWDDEADEEEWDEFPPAAYPFAAPYSMQGWYPMFQPLFRAPSGCSGRLVVLTAVALVSLFIIMSMWPGSNGKISGWQGPLDSITSSLGLPNPFAPPPAPRPPGDYNLRGAQSLTAEQIDAILASYNSPASGTGQAWVALGEQYNIDAAFAVAFFIHESSAGTNPGWAGLKENGTTTHNVGNIICAGYDRCHGRFRDYGSWEEGIEDWYRLIDQEYLRGRDMKTVADIIPVYAPAFENDVNGYINAVQRLVDDWRSEVQEGRNPTGKQMQPWGNPLRATNTVMTQGYGIGTHAPIAIWGAIDLALDDDGDGTADPEGTAGKPIYATHAGTVIITPDSYPGGNHMWVENDQYRTGYAHLTEFTAEHGQWVQAGEQIGTIGSTGLSSGPHLDYQVWKREGDTWVNQNPLEFGALPQ